MARTMRELKVKAHDDQNHKNFGSSSATPRAASQTIRIYFDTIRDSLETNLTADAIAD